MEPVVLHGGQRRVLVYFLVVSRDERERLFTIRPVLLKVRINNVKTELFPIDLKIAVDKDDGSFS